MAQNGKLIGILPNYPTRNDWIDDGALMRRAMPIIWPSDFVQLAIKGASDLIKQNLPLSLPTNFLMNMGTGIYSMNKFGRQT